jgi:hypothetical protein
MQASAARTVGRALAVTPFIAILGVAPMIPSATSPSPTEILARVNGRDAGVSSYSVPIHVDVRVRKLLTFRMGFDGTQYFKRPDKISLDAPRIPAQGRKLFAELGTPLTWPQQYDLRLVSANGERGPYHLEGVPKQPSGIAKMQVDIDDDPSVPLHAQWLAHDGSTIDMRITQQTAGGYEFPRHAETDLNVSGYKIHASIDYGTYSVNEAIATSVFDSRTTR